MECIKRQRDAMRWASESKRSRLFWSLRGLTQAAIHPKTAKANHGDAETRRKTD